MTTNGISPELLARLSAAVACARPEVDLLYARVPDDVPEQAVYIGRVRVCLVHHIVDTTPDWRMIHTDPMPPERVAWVMDKLAGLTPGTALDVGCGTGNLVRALQDAGWRSMGFDVCPGNVARCVDAHASCVLSAVDRWDWSVRYDLILAVAVLEHLPCEQHRLIPAIRGAAGRLCVLADCETISSLHTRPDLQGLLGEPVEECGVEVWPGRYRWMVWG